MPTINRNHLVSDIVEVGTRPWVTIAKMRHNSTKSCAQSGHTLDNCVVVTLALAATALTAVCRCPHRLAAQVRLNQIH